ncbi:DMT family transporter [Castellaniella sp.]|uniref:DMT family transporter n=1 Tax=Castellaniella sp. TaxID=1955812 RepID=UPI002AFDF77E|nr:DMT family transporter [Castellaniella sp.]
MTTEKSSPPWLGPVLMCGASLCFAMLDAGTKYLAAHYPLMQIVWVRYMAQTLAVALIFAPAMGRQLLMAHRYGIQLLRGLCLCCGSVFVINGLARLPLAETTAIVFLAPVLIVMLSGLLLKEKARTMDWLAVGCGFIGVLIIARPGGGLLTWAILFPLGSALCNALYQLVTRSVRASEHAATSNFYTGLIGVLILTPWGVSDWAPMQTMDFMLLLGIGGIASVGHLTITYALLHAPATKLGVYSYAQILWATILGGLIFGTLPDTMAWLGILVITLGGLVLSVPQVQKIGAAILRSGRR